MAKKEERLSLKVGDRELSISSPSKVYFPEKGHTKLDLIQYYLAVADGALRGAGGRPNVMKRWLDGQPGEPFFQKRAPTARPPWLGVVTLKFPSGREADEIVPREAADLAWIAGQGCLDLNPHPVRAEDLEHPDELRVDLDPMPGIGWPELQAVSREVRAALSDLGMVGWPKTSGSRGIHVLVRIAPRWTFPEVRRAALALAREIERRMPGRATAKWWKEEREGVFLDFNQNAKDRTVASAYGVRPLPDARVSAPVTWDELDVCDPADFTLATVPARFAAIGDPHAGIDRPESVCSLDALLELSRKQEAEGQGDAPWPPHYQKADGEPARVQPSRAKKSKPEGESGGRRVSKHPLIEIARAEHKDAAVAGLERWKARHADIVAFLTPTDVLTDAMRGRYKTWTRIRVNLRHVPEAQRPPQEPLEVDYDARSEWDGTYPLGDRPRRPEGEPTE